MNVLAVLLADFEVVKNMSSRFHGKQAQLHSNDLLAGLAMLLAVVLAAWGLSRLTRRSDDRPRSNNPRRLFRELCEAHGIDRHGRGTLERIANVCELPPARLFLEPQRWQPEMLDARLASHREHCRELYDRIFAEAEHVDETPVHAEDVAAEAVGHAPCA